MTSKKFDIRDCQNYREPCPQCGGTFCTGLVLVFEGNIQLKALQCHRSLDGLTWCGFTGPAFEFDPQNPLSSDKLAFDAWNALPRESLRYLTEFKGVYPNKTRT